MAFGQHHRFMAEMEAGTPVAAMLAFDADAARQVEAVYLTADVVQQRGGGCAADQP